MGGIPSEKAVVGMAGRVIVYVGVMAGPVIVLVNVDVMNLISVVVGIIANDGLMPDVDDLPDMFEAEVPMS